MSEGCPDSVIPYTELKLMGGQESHRALLFALRQAFGEEAIQILSDEEEVHTLIRIDWAIYHPGAGGAKIHTPWPYNDMWQHGDRTDFIVPNKNSSPSSFDLRSTPHNVVRTTWDRYNPFLSDEKQPNVASKS